MNYIEIKPNHQTLCCVNTNIGSDSVLWFCLLDLWFPVFIFTGSKMSCVLFTGARPQRPTMCRRGCDITEEQFILSDMKTTRASWKSSSNMEGPHKSCQIPVGWFKFRPRCNSAQNFRLVCSISLNMSTVSPPPTRWYTCPPSQIIPCNKSSNPSLTSPEPPLGIGWWRFEQIKRFQRVYEEDCVFGPGSLVV